MLKFTRIRPGYYTTKASTTLYYTDGRVKIIDVDIHVMHEPEWNGPEKWTATVEGPNNLRLVHHTDIIEASYKGIKEAIERSIVNGYQQYPGIGWAAK